MPGEFLQARVIARTCVVAADGGRCDPEPPRLKPHVDMADMAVTCQVTHTRPVITVVSDRAFRFSALFIDLSGGTVF